MKVDNVPYNDADVLAQIAALQHIANNLVFEYKEKRAPEILSEVLQEQVKYLDRISKNLKQMATGIGQPPGAKLGQI